MLPIEKVSWFLKLVQNRSKVGEESLWNAFVEWTPPKTIQAVSGEKLTWTFVGAPDTIGAHFPFLKGKLNDQEEQTFNQENNEHLVFQWLTLDYVPLSLVRHKKINTPTTLFVEKRLPVESRTLFHQQVVYNIVSNQYLRLPESLNHINQFVTPNGTLEQIITPTRYPVPKGEKVELVDIPFSNHFMAKFDSLKQKKVEFLEYWALIDEVIADALNRYWLANKPSLLSWLMDTLKTVGPLQNRIFPYVENYDIPNIIKELEQWISKLQMQDPRYKN